MCCTFNFISSRRDQSSSRKTRKEEKEKKKKKKMRVYPELQSNNPSAALKQKNPPRLMRLNAMGRIKEIVRSSFIALRPNISSTIER